MYVSGRTGKNRYSRRERSMILKYHLGKFVVYSVVIHSVFSLTSTHHVHLKIRKLWAAAVRQLLLSACNLSHTISVSLDLFKILPPSGKILSYTT